MTHEFLALSQKLYQATKRLDQEARWWRIGKEHSDLYRILVIKIEEDRPQPEESIAIPTLEILEWEATTLEEALDRYIQTRTE